MPLSVQSLDHLVLTVRDIDLSVQFYTSVLGMRSEQFAATDGTTRWALKFGNQKINLHRAGAEFDPKADRPTSGSADLCFLSSARVEHWQQHLAAAKVPIVDGPIRRTGATAPILSIYIRDPDQNLIEIGMPITD